MIRFIIILTIFFSKNLFACTIFSVNQDKKHVLVGNNCDNSYQPSKCLHIEPGNDLKYGAIYFGSAFYEQSGVNEYGLFYSNATIPEWSEKNYPPNGNVCKKDIRKKMLQECKTVEEAIRLINNYKTNLFINHHMLIADKTGKSAIVEWDGNNLNIIWKEKYYQIATNFILSHIENDKLVSCSRYINAKKILFSQNVSIETCQNILDETHANNTLYSTIVDLKKGIIYLFLDHDYDNVITLNILEELNKNNNPVSLKLSSLFEPLPSKDKPCSDSTIFIQDNTGKSFSVKPITTLHELIKVSKEIGKDYRIKNEDTEQSLSCLKGIALDLNFTRSQVFSINDGSLCIGIATLLVTPYQNINNLIYFKIIDDKLVAKSFSELFNVPPGSYIIEPAFMKILPKYRHKKLGEAILKGVIFPTIENLKKKSHEEIIILSGAQGNGDKQIIEKTIQILKAGFGEILITSDMKPLLGKARSESTFSLHQVQKYLYQLDGVVNFTLGPVFAKNITYQSNQ